MVAFAGVLHHPGEYSHTLKTNQRRDSNDSCLQLGQSRESLCFPRDETTTNMVEQVQMKNSLSFLLLCIQCHAQAQLKSVPRDNSG